MTASSPNKPAATPEGTTSGPVGTRYIRSLLNRRNVPSMRHVTTIAEVLGVSYSIAHRRMNGTAAWELEEIEQVAGHFGESLADLFASPTGEDAVPAMLVAGTTRIPCQLVVGNVTREPQGNSLVATKVGEQWLVLPAAEAGGLACFDVARLVVVGRGDRAWRIAVLDDDAAEANSLARHLSDRGCEAQAFTRVEDLVPQMNLRPFDGYVIDWVLAEGSAAELVGMIRADDRECPIAVLTGQIRSDVLIEPEVAEAVSTYKLLFFEKPTRLAIISAQLLRSLAGR